MTNPGPGQAGNTPPPPPPSSPPPGYGYQAPPPPPPPGYGYGPYPYPYPQYAYRPPHPSGIPDGERTMAGIAHLSVFFAPLILPLILWLVARGTQPYAAHQSKQAFFFHLIFTVLILVLVLPLWLGGFFLAIAASAGGNPNDASFGAFPLIFCGVWLVAVVLGITQIVFGIYAAVQAFNGRPYHYPLLGGI